MWRSMNKNVPRAFSERRNVSTYAGDLLSGAMLFNKRFTQQWAADGYRDYLSPDPIVLESGLDVLHRLLNKKGDSVPQLTSASAMSALESVERSRLSSTPGESYASPQLSSSQQFGRQRKPGNDIDTGADAPTAAPPLGYPQAAGDVRQPYTPYGYEQQSPFSSHPY